MADVASKDGVETIKAPFDLKIAKKFQKIWKSKAHDSNKCLCSHVDIRFSYGRSNGTII